MDKETEFFLRKMEFDYGDEKVEKELKQISKGIDWLRGWPDDKRAFWNGEAFMWGNKIGSDKRELIGAELSFLDGKRKKNLDLGCGSYSYIGSVGFDMSDKMLLFNERLSEKVNGDLEEELPFKSKEFDSATLVFVLSYVRDYLGLLNEIFRVLKKEGKLVVVQSVKGVGEWHKQKKMNEVGLRGWEKILASVGFKVQFYEKKGLGFFKCEKGNYL